MIDRDPIPKHSPKDLVKQSLKRIANVSVGGLDREAIRVTELIDRGVFDIAIALTNLGAIRPWISNFKARIGPDEQTLKGVIEVEPARIGAGSNHRFDAEMVRTMAVAAQFDTVTYLTPLRYVYERALSVQKKWLDKRAGVLFDPRSVNHTVIIRNLLGDEVYYGDFGYVHWMKAIEERVKQMRAEKVPESLIDIVENRCSTPEAFMKERVVHGKNPAFREGFNIDKRNAYDEKPFEALAYENAVRVVGKLL